MVVPNDVSAQVVIDTTSDEGGIAGLRDELAAQGLDVGPLVGNNFSITGSPRNFLQLFGNGGDTSESTTGLTEMEAVHRLTTDQMLPLDGLQLRDKHLISAVVIGSPPDFGPSDF